MNAWDIATGNMGLVKKPPVPPGWPDQGSSAHRFLTYIEKNPGCTAVVIQEALEISQVMVAKHVKRFHTLIWSKRVPGPNGRSVTAHYILGSAAAIAVANRTKTPEPGVGQNPGSKALEAATLQRCIQGPAAAKQPDTSTALLPAADVSEAALHPDPELAHIKARRAFFAVDEEGFVGIQDIDDGKVKLSPADQDALVLWAEKVRPLR